jgi:hypothetical protein
MGKEVKIFTWKGDNIQDTLALMLTAKDLSATNEGLCISVEAESTEVVFDKLISIIDGPITPAEKLAEYVKNKQQEKWDWLLPYDLLNRNYASLYINVNSALQAIQELLKVRKN